MEAAALKVEAVSPSDAPEVKAEILFSMAGRITFASHQNDVSVIPDLVVRNLSGDLLDDLELKLECDPPLIQPQIWKIDRIAPEGEVRLKDKSVSVSGSLLSELTEQMRSEAKLTLSQRGDVLCQEVHILIGLAKNEWGGAAYMPELLAAFVMPNDPAVAKLLKQAAEILRKAGKPASLEGYQSRSRQRVWEIASAIWTALSARRVVYAEPPASFESEGQKIRTPGEVLETGLATCLDSTVLFAAALEQAGLNPIISFTKGHALCGVWLQPQQLPALTTDDASELRKHIALKELAVFETTLVTNEPPLPFSAAVREGEKKISEENESNFVYAIDIERARRQQISPLSTARKTVNEDGKEEKVLELGLEAAPELPSFDFDISNEPVADTPETRLDNWKRKLLDLTKRNRLLNLKTSKTAIRLLCSDPAILEDKLADGKKITVIPFEKPTGQLNDRDESLFLQRTGGGFKERFVEAALERDEIVSDMPKPDLDAGMTQLYRKAKTDLQEGGANTLYLALGVLRWKQSESEERSYRAPLVLIPVKLERRSAASRIRLVHHDDEAVFNMTLLEMLRQDFDLRIPELEGELPKDHSGLDIPLIWELVRKAIREMKGFEVVEEVVLSTFSFAKYLMWKDLAERTDILKESPFVKHLIDTPREAYEHSASFLDATQVDEKIKPSELFMPLPADSSQIVAVHASAQGGDFILEGPPGTGKSQTIANIIAHNIALGRKVLFVSEKMAALEVVYKRLCDKGLGNFCLELHSNKANKKHVIDQLGKSWSSRSAHTQVEWLEEAERLESARNDLNGLVSALHSPHATGISPRAAIGRAAKYQDLHRYRLDWEGSLEAGCAQDKHSLTKLEDAALKLGQCYGELTQDDKEAFADVVQTTWSNAWQSQLVNQAQQVTQAVDKLLDAQNTFCQDASLPQVKPSQKRLRGLALIAEGMEVAAHTCLEFGLGAYASPIFDVFEAGLQAIQRYETGKKQLSCQYSDEAIKAIQLEPWQAQWEKANSFVWPVSAIQSWLVTSKFRKACNLTAAPDMAKDLPVLEGLLKELEVIGKTTSELPNNAPWNDLKTDIEKAEEALRAARSIREGLVMLATDANDLVAWRTALKSILVDGQELIQSGMPAAEAAKAFKQSIAHFQSSCDRFIEKAGRAESEVDTDDIEELRGRCQRIVDLQPRINCWCRWQAACREAESSGIGTLVAALESGSVPAEEAGEAFKTAYALWLAPLLIDSRPELRQFSSLEHQQKIRDFCELDQRLANLSIDYIRAKLSGGIPSTEDRVRPAGYGILARELQKKMRHKPIRQLVSEMDQVLTSLTPCLFMSPLSVAQFLSPDSDLFDLVVFDEASQITVWDAMGAIARGRNVIIVGDPKQMPPTGFFNRAASDSESEDDDIDDLESILDEALAASIKLHRLTGHYRSRHESLIAFSNHRYYGGELVTYPSAETKQSAVSLMKVAGEYQRGRGRTNPDEAKAVVKEVIRRLSDPELSKWSIGVVTLNSEQQRLIDDLLDNARRTTPGLEQFFDNDCEEPVFVKNLETVQGDQRDVIMISIGYGPDAPGAKTMSMNFGPLNKKGGERRLNVAITRAASEVLIFSSFDSSMIDLTRTSAAAVRDLKHYMEYAERGPAALGEAVIDIGGEDAYDSDFEAAVAERLRQKGWTVHTQIGVSKFRIDLGIVHPDSPGKYLAGVECDGAAYHSSPSARDRDRVRHNILENLGWNLVRIWSTDFWVDPRTTIDSVDEKLKKLLEESRAEPQGIELKAEQAESEFVDDLMEEVSEDGGSSAANELVQLNPDLFYEREYLPVLEGACARIIDKIGPITFRHLSTKIARMHGFNRTGSQIKKQVWAAIAKKRVYTPSPNGEKVFWPQAIKPQEMIPFRGMKLFGEERKWQDIPYPERLGLATSVTHLGLEEAVSGLARKLELGRLHKSTKDELEQLIETALVQQPS